MLICAILSLKTFRLRWPLSFRLFTVLFFVALATEIFARLWVFYPYTSYAFEHPSGNNAWIFSLSMIPQYLLMMSVYYYHTSSKKLRKGIIATAIIFVTFALINFIFWQKAEKINSNTHLLACLIMLLLNFIYFEELRKGDNLTKLSQQPLVWISAGIFAYHLLSIPFLFILNFLNENYMPLAQTFFYVYQVFIFIAYILYTIAFLCPTPQQK